MKCNLNEIFCAQRAGRLGLMTSSSFCEQVPTHPRNGFVLILALCQATSHKFTFKFISVNKRLYLFASYSFKLLADRITLNTFPDNFHIRLMLLGRALFRGCFQVWEYVYRDCNNANMLRLTHASFESNEQGRDDILTSIPAKKNKLLTHRRHELNFALFNRVSHWIWLHLIVIVE